jgi:hypothetical protein
MFLFIETVSIDRNNDSDFSSQRQGVLGKKVKKIQKFQDSIPRIL